VSEQLVLSLFPGIGLLDMAFEMEGFTVVRGPDVLWGGDIRRFHPPAGRFDGVIGGPPCQAHSTYAHLNKAQGKNVREDLVPEYLRVVSECKPRWWLMENSPQVPTVELGGYITHVFTFNPQWLGEEQDRLRKWQFGTPDGLKVWPETDVFLPQTREPVCMASEGKSGRLTTVRINGKSRTRHNPRRSPDRFCELQGLPPDFMDSLPFTNEWKYRVIGNGVPLPMGRAIAKAVMEATGVKR
jgi:DNA (cytosine-5)-methyltransferase 1